jgi:hypothetical protein
MVNTKSETIGPIPTDHEGKKLLKVIHRAYLKPFTTRSNFARVHAEVVAQAACCGLITTITDKRTFSNTFRPTPFGLVYLWEHFSSD